MNYFASLPFTNFPIRLTKKTITYRNSMIDVTSHVFISRLTTKKKVSIMSHLYITPYMLCSCHIYFFNTFFFYPLATPFQSHGTKQDRKPYTHFLPLFSELSENIYVFFLLYFSVQRINYIKYVRLDQPTTFVESRLLPVNIIKIKTKIV